MHRTVTTWDEFASQWSGQRNFLMGGECDCFDFDFPPLAQVVEELRADEGARIGPGTKGNQLNQEDYSDAFRRESVETCLSKPFSLAHFQLGRFDKPGGFLHGFKEQVVERWQGALREQGFTWDRCYPIIFISGPGCATNYHMDFSHVLAWQIYGEKRFHGLREPDRWAPREARLTYRPEAFSRPSELTDSDALSYDMPPGSLLWNALLTPHWVEANDAAAMSVNISHGGLRLHGELSRNEAELEAFRQSAPEQAPKPFEGRY